MMNPYVWRQHREDMMREVKRDHLASSLRADRKEHANHMNSLRWELGRIAGLLYKRLGKTRQGRRP